MYFYVGVLTTFLMCRTRGLVAVGTTGSLIQGSDPDYFGEMINVSTINDHLSFEVRASRGHLLYKEMKPREARTSNDK